MIGIKSGSKYLDEPGYHHAVGPLYWNALIDLIRVFPAFVGEYQEFIKLDEIDGKVLWG